MMVLTVPSSYDHIRPLSYPNANVFLICFSVDSPTSLENVKYKWVPEVRKHRPGAPIILVGTKADLRSATGKARELISLEVAEQESKAVRAIKYMECSAMKNENVKEVFEEALYNGLFPPEVKTDKKKSCTLL